MNSITAAVNTVLKARPAKGRLYGRITNEELLGVKARSRLEQSGVDLKAKSMRDQVNPILESEHGLGLVPDDYAGTWKIVDVNERAAHVISKRMEKIGRLLVAQADGRDSVLSDTVLGYQTNPYINEEMEHLLMKCGRALAAIELVAEEALMPKLGRIKAIVDRHKAEEDKE